jgi:hypothetical protein
VPVALAERLTGFRHDFFTPPGREDCPFEVLEPRRGGWAAGLLNPTLERTKDEGPAVPLDRPSLDQDR